MFKLLVGRDKESPSRSVREVHRDEARRWFFEPSDFDWWCGVAGYEPEMVRERARTVERGGMATFDGGRRGGWSRQDEELLMAQKLKGESNAKIAAMLGRSAATVAVRYSILKKLEAAAKR